MTRGSGLERVELKRGVYAKTRVPGKWPKTLRLGAGLQREYCLRGAGVFLLLKALS